MKKQKYDLEDRLVDYAVRIIKLVEALPKSHSGLHLGKQLLRVVPVRQQITVKRKAQNREKILSIN